MREGPPGGIGILCGGGRLPLMVAESVVAQGGRVHFIAFEGEVDDDVRHYPHTWVKWGQVGRIVSTMHAQGCRELVIAGAVKRPDLGKLKPDLGFFTSLPIIIGLMAGGDDSVLSRVVRFFEQKGLVVRGAHEVAPDLLAGAGHLGGPLLSGQGMADAGIGFAVRAALGPLDAGQAVAVAGGRVLAIEGAEGTDAMLRRVAGLRETAGDAREGVLAKGPKPGQELRVDMPAIGPRTVQACAAAGLAGIAIEAGAVLVLGKAEAVQAAEGLGVAVHGLPRLPSAPAGGPAARASPVPAGRLRPGRRDLADIGKGLAAVTALEPFDAGASVVVSRAYILAIEGAEGPVALLSRTGALRQWGLRGRGRVGVMVRRIRSAEEAPAMVRLLEQAAAQGLAGLALTGPAEAVAACRHGAAADGLGVFLVTSSAQ